MRKLLVLANLLVLSASAAELTFDPAKSTVTFSVPTTLHVVHGEFRLKRGSVSWSPESGVASGEIVIDVAAGATGNGSRDKRMHSVVLESAKFPEAVLRVDRITGEGAVTVHGTLMLHGASHEVTVPMQVTRAEGEVTAVGSFSVPYTAWGMKDASQLLLRVNPRVEVQVTLRGR